MKQSKIEAPKILVRFQESQYAKTCGRTVRFANDHVGRDDYWTNTCSMLIASLSSHSSRQLDEPADKAWLLRFEQDGFGECSLLCLPFRRLTCLLPPWLV